MRREIPKNFARYTEKQTWTVGLDKPLNAIF